MEKIARYRIEEIISENGPVSVYRARHENLDRDTLLKVYQGGDTQLIKRFEQEARIVADFKDDKIVSVYDFGRWKNRFFIAMEFIDGWNLGSYLDERRLSIDDTIGLCFKILDAVRVIHSKGYMHRDLKPDNILVDRRHNIKITDFGISLQKSMARSTSEGALVGTPLYMSPEQINNLDLTPASDIFSLGIIFYEMITGTNPFEASRYGEIFANILSRTPEPLTAYKPEIPGWFSDLIDKMLLKDPEDRPQNAGEALRFYPYKPIENVVKQTNENHSGISRWPSIKWMTILIVVLIGGSLVIRFQQNITTWFGFGGTGTDSLNYIVRTDSVRTDTADPDTGLHRPDTTGNTGDPADIVRDTTVDAQDSKPEPDTSLPTTFHIETFPWCKIYLDYEYLDTTPMDSIITIEPGRYLLSLRNPSYVPAWSDSIEIKPHRKNMFAINLDSLYYRLNLFIHPYGEIYINDRFLGEAPLKEPLLLSRQDHVLSVKNKYFKTFKDTLRWNGEREVSKRIVLKEID